MTRDAPPRPRGLAALNFSDEVRTAVATIDRLCSRPAAKLHFFFGGHVSGIKNLVYSKAIDMAILYRAIRSGDRPTRLRALERLRDEANNYQGLEMPFNTRRILIALMKETVKERSDVEQRWRYIAAFRQTLSGRAYVVRTMLDELGLAEVPEDSGKGGSRSEPPAWDDHVYDSAGPGRKTPAQLVLDAYIKGLSRLTIVYEDLMDVEAMEEALSSGEIMGIRVSIGVECLVRTSSGESAYHVLELDPRTKSNQVGALLSSPRFKRLRKLLERDYAEYERVYARLLSAFNARGLGAVNAGFEGTDGELAPLTLKDLKEYASGRHLFHVHLGHFLSRKLALLAAARARIRPEAERLDEVHHAELRRRFFDPIYEDVLTRGEFLEAAKLYETVDEIDRDLDPSRPGEAGLDSLGIEIGYTRVLGGDLGIALRHVLANPREIHSIEVWNNRIRGEQTAERARALERFRVALNRGDIASVRDVLDRFDVRAVPDETLDEAVRRYRDRPLKARVASASDGYNHFAPGMGFVPLAAVRNGRAVMRTNRSAPLAVEVELIGADRGRQVTKLLPLGKNRAPSLRADRFSSAAAPTRPEDRGPRPRRWAAAAFAAFHAFVRRYRDLNSTIRQVARMAAGAILAVVLAGLVSAITGFPFSFTPFVMAAWFAVTYSRNCIVDEVARHGLHPSRWKWSSFDRTNAANSVFFTFLSIALLRFVEQLLDRYVIGGAALSWNLSDVELRLLRFVPLALVNGTYIYSHNTLRGFTKPVKRANFWRSALAFPLAVGLSYLNPWGALIPGALINKVASDIIGGFTEVTFKILRETKRARQLYADLLPLLAAVPTDKRERYRQRLAVLDVLYVWGNTPRGKDALRRAVASHPEAAAIWSRLADPVRSYEKYETLITKKTSWRKPQRIKLEFLRLSAAFSYWLERNRLYRVD